MMAPGQLSVVWESTEEWVRYVWGGGTLVAVETRHGLTWSTVDAWSFSLLNTPQTYQEFGAAAAAHYAEHKEEYSNK